VSESTPHTVRTRRVRSPWSAFSSFFCFMPFRWVHKLKAVAAIMSCVFNQILNVILKFYQILNTSSCEVW